MPATTVDLLLTNATLVTMNNTNDIFINGAVAVNKDTIVAVGPTESLTTQYQAAQTINCQGCVISPGLVNAHTHVPMTLLRGLSDDLRLDVWLYGFMMPVEREFVTPEFSYTGALLAGVEMIRSGITTFCDMYYFEDQIAQATAEAGLRAICAQTILKFPAPDASNYDDSLNYCRRFIEKWKGHPLITPAVGPHAPYTATPEMLQACADLATRYDVPIHIHIAETTLEQETSKTEYGTTVVPWLAQYGIFNAKVIAAHCIHLEDAEIQILKAAHAGAVHCPSSNLKLASGVAPVHHLLKMGLNVGIGTDGPASNNDLDMIEETRLTALLQKGTFANPTLLPAKQAWQLATIGGARALQLDHLIGSLEPGKKADLIAIDLTAAHQTPRFTYTPDAIYSQLVYAAKSTDVRHVMVNGKLLMHNRTLLTLNEADLQQKAIEIARKIDAFITHREGNLMSKLLAISSGVIPVETFEVQNKVALTNIQETEAKLNQLPVTISRASIRKQYDTYFIFEQDQLGRIRHREDEVLNPDGTIDEVLYRINLIGPAVERTFDNSIILSRSRYSVPADKSLRFYREYFQPHHEIQVEKLRKRYHITYKDTGFALNFDTLSNSNTYLEIKSRTWSAKDADEKAELITELLIMLGVEPPPGNPFTEYFVLV